MLGNILFFVGLGVAAGVGFAYFRDLGDVSQMFLRVKRKHMVRFIRHEYQLLAVGLSATALMALAYFLLDGGAGWLFWPALLLFLVLYGFPWVYVHLGLRNQMSTAKYYSIDDAKELVSPSSSVVVIEKDGVARAHPDSQIMRPHLAGNAHSQWQEDRRHRIVGDHLSKDESQYVDHGQQQIDHDLVQAAGRSDDRSLNGGRLRLCPSLGPE